MTDDFHRSDRDINGDTSPSGASYLVPNNTATSLAIENSQLVRSNPQTYGPAGAPIVLWPLPNPPRSVSAQFVLTPGSTSGQSVVVGTCAQSFSQSSIQLAIFQSRWVLSYTYAADPSSPNTAIVDLATGSIPSLTADGTTLYDVGMQVSPDYSSVTVVYPGGSQVVANPAIAQYWGYQLGAQIRHPHATDGDARFTSISASWMSS